MSTISLGIPVGAADRFTDDNTSVHETDIQTIAAAGITFGCNPPQNDHYCPTQPVTRAQMASFLTRALHLPPSHHNTFTDDNTSVHESDIQAIAAADITYGCNPPQNNHYCPTQPVTRAQMASFLTRALGLSPGTTTSSTAPTSSTSPSSTTSNTGSTTTTPPISCPPVDHGNTPPATEGGEWDNISSPHDPTARHENGFVAVGGDFYLLGGRGEKQIERFDGHDWTDTGESTDDIHHFQAVAYDGRIWMVGAMEGNFPVEQPLAEVLVYDPSDGSFEEVGPSLDPTRQRGSGGAVVYCDRIYLVGGVTEGHEDGTTVGYFDVFDPVSETWQARPNMPHRRDHFQSVVVGHRLYAIGGRITEGDDFFDNLVPEVDVFNFETGQWLVADEAPDDLPTPRAAAAVAAVGDAIYVIGGETDAGDALGTVERLDTETGTWSDITLDPVPEGRHGTQAVVCGGAIYMAAGSTTRGANGETNRFDVFYPTVSVVGC